MSDRWGNIPMPGPAWVQVWWDFFSGAINQISGWGRTPHTQPAASWDRWGVRSVRSRWPRAWRKTWRRGEVCVRSHFLRFWTELWQFVSANEKSSVFLAKPLREADALRKADLLTGLFFFWGGFRGLRGKRVKRTKDERELMPALQLVQCHPINP